MKRYARHAPASDEIYCALMSERTGEDPDNYRGRPFDMELLTFAPSAPPPPPFPPRNINGQYRRLADSPQA